MVWVSFAWKGLSEDFILVASQGGVSVKPDRRRFVVHFPDGIPAVRKPPKPSTTVNKGPNVMLMCEKLAKDTFFQKLIKGGVLF